MPNEDGTTAEDQIAALEARVDDLTAKLAEGGQSGGESGSDDDDTQAGSGGQSADGSQTGGSEDAEAPGWFRRFFGGGKPKGTDEGGNQADDSQTGDGEGGGEDDGQGSDSRSGLDPNLSKALEAIGSKLDSMEQRFSKLDDGERDRVLADLKVDPKYRRFAPNDIDYSTDEGKLKAEQWASEHPEVAPNRRPPPPEIDVDELPEIPFGPTKHQMAAAIAKAMKTDWTVH